MFWCKWPNKANILDECTFAYGSDYLRHDSPLFLVPSLLLEITKAAFKQSTPRVLGPHEQT